MELVTVIVTAISPGVINYIPEGTNLSYHFGRRGPSGVLFYNLPNKVKEIDY